MAERDEGIVGEGDAADARGAVVGAVGRFEIGDAQAVVGDADVAVKARDLRVAEDEVDGRIAADDEPAAVELRDGAGGGDGGDAEALARRLGSVHEHVYSMRSIAARLGATDMPTANYQKTVSRGWES